MAKCFPATPYAPAAAKPARVERRENRYRDLLDIESRVVSTTVRSSASKMQNASDNVSSKHELAVLAVGAFLPAFGG